MNIPVTPNFYRCGKCRHAKRLKRELYEYARPPRCVCGVRDWRVDNHRRKEWLNRTGVYNTCNCIGLHHPHRKGSSVWCEHHPTGATEEDYEKLHKVDGLPF